MKADFTKVQLVDIEGKEVQSHELHKAIADILWKKAKNLDLVDIAMQMNRGEEVELTDSLKGEIIQMMKDPNCGLAAFARKAVIDYLTSLD